MSNSIWDELNIKQASSKEQAEKAIEDVAAAIASFRHALVQNGLTKEEALYLTGIWVTATVQSGKK